MSGLTPEAESTPIEPATGDGANPVSAPLPALQDIGITIAWFVAAGLLGALAWWQLTPLAEFTRTADNGVMDEQQLAIQVATDGWFVVVAAVGGLISGIALLSWRRRDPVLMVVLVTLGGALATWVMLTAGLAIGPPDPDTVLGTAKEGTKIPVQLDPSATGIYVTWSIAALIGAVGVIWGTESTGPRVRDEASREA